MFVIVPAILVAGTIFKTRIMKKILFIVLCSLAANVGIAQNFNERYLFDKLAAIFFNVFEYKDTITVQGVTGFYLSDLVTGTTIAKIGQDGAVLDTQIAVFDSLESNFPKDIAIKGDKIYSFGHGGYGFSYFAWATIMRLDQNFRPLWIKKYTPQDLVGNGFYFLAGKLLSNGDLLTMGVDRHYFDITILSKFDSLGNLKWEKKYKAPGYSYDCKSLLVLNDSTYLIGLRISPFPAVKWGSRNAIIKTDSSGNVLDVWEDESGPNGIGGRGVEKMVGMEDGGVIFVGYRFFEDTIIGLPNSDIELQSVSYICRLDSNFNKVWERDVGMYAGAPDIYNVGLRDVIRLSDGNYLGVGETGRPIKIIDGIPYPKWSGLVVKFTADGEVLWERYHNYFPDYQVFAIELFYSAAELSDGSLVACGMSDLDTGYQEGWIVKMFPNGMIDTVNQVFDVGGSGIPDAISVSPNPASSYIDVENKKGLIQAVQLYDMAGQLVYTDVPRKERVRIVVENLPKGMYLLVVNGRLVQRFLLE